MREPAPHGLYSPDEAVVLFGGGPVEPLCDGQFLVLPEAVLCLVTLGEGGRLQAPSRIEWRPARLDHAPGDTVPWLPERAREIWSRDRKTKLREHHMFLRLPGEPRFLHAGQAHLGGYGGRPPSVSASFSLAQRLPREAWLRFGGSPGWEVELDHQTHQVAAGDRAGFGRLLARVAAADFAHLTLTRYEEDALTLHTNPQRGWLMYLREPGDVGLYNGDPCADDLTTAERFPCDGCDLPLDCPRAQTLPREQAMRVVLEFFDTAELPRSVRWSEG